MMWLRIGELSKNHGNYVQVPNMILKENCILMHYISCLITVKSAWLTGQVSYLLAVFRYILGLSEISVKSKEKWYSSCMATQ